VDFKITTNFNRREFDKLIKQKVDGAIKDEVGKTQAILDRLLRDYQGRPMHEVKEALIRECQRTAITPNDEMATEWATAISEGTRILLNARRSPS
jgi:hypothetical protein